MRRTQDYVLPAIFLVCGGVMMWQALAKLTYFEVRRGAPGPGFLPFWLSLGLIVISVAIIVSTARQPRPAEAPTARPEDPLLAEMEADAEEEASWPTRLGWTRIAWLMLPFLGMLLVFERLGFFLSAAAYILLAAYGLGFRRLVILVPSAILCAGLLYVLFAHWLGVNLPAGPFAS